MKVLMVEDNVFKSVEMTRALRDIRYEGEWITDITEAADRETAISCLQTEKFDLILLDMFFPGFKGGPEEKWAGFKILDWLMDNDIHIPVICTSTVRSNLMSYPDCVGQMVYLQDDTAFRLKELINQIPYLYE